MANKDKPRFQDIKYDTSGDAFVTYYGCKHYLNEFFRCEYTHNGIALNGMKTMSNSYGLGIIINDSGDAAKVVSVY